MSLFDFESKSFFDSFYEIEEGVYLKKYHFIKQLKMLTKSILLEILK